MRGNPYSKLPTALTAMVACFISSQARSETPCRDCTAILTHETGLHVTPLAPWRLLPNRDRPTRDGSELFLGTIRGDIVERRGQMTVELDRGSLSLDAGRRYARRGIWPDAAGQSRSRYSSWALGLHYRDESDELGTIMLGLSAAMDRRRFAIDLTDGRWSRSEAVRAEASWTGADRWLLTAGYRIANGDSRASGIRRSIELAQGATPSTHGFRLAIGFSPAGFSASRPLSFGLEMQGLTLSTTDATAFGNRTSGDDRLLATLAAHF